MTELEIKIIKFLLSSAVYSENAIMKNLGIDKKTLNKSFKVLEENGYLESYEDFIKREKLNEEGDCCKVICMMRYIFLHKTDYAGKQKLRKTVTEKPKVFTQFLFFTMTGIYSSVVKGRRKQIKRGC